MSMPESDAIHDADQEVRDHDGWVPEIVPRTEPVKSNPQHPIGEQPFGPNNVDEARHKVQDAIERNVAEAHKHREDELGELPKAS